MVERWNCAARSLSLSTPLDGSTLWLIHTVFAKGKSKTGRCVAPYFIQAFYICKIFYNYAQKLERGGEKEEQDGFGNTFMRS